MSESKSNQYTGATDQKVQSCCAPQIGRIALRSASNEKLDPVSQARDAIQNEMVTVPGGTFLMGTDYSYGFPADGEGPVRPVSLSSFAIDPYPVTNEDFTRFVKATGYRTEAENFGWSFVFWLHIAEDRFEEVVEDTVAQAPWWCKVPGAFWQQPEGPGSDLENRTNHPVVHVSWNDAQAYAAWASKLLPTEAQWEYAARGGLEQKLFPWGDELTPNGKHMANVWQGTFPHQDTADDGYSGTCPVDSFPSNNYGIYSMTGNVWEWCSDWFGIPSAAQTLRDPSGPLSGTTKVMKGGSFLCHASYCNRYRVAARTSNSPDSSASNIGFRCVRSSVHTLGV